MTQAGTRLLVGLAFCGWALGCSVSDSNAPQARENMGAEKEQHDNGAAGAAAVSGTAPSTTGGSTTGPGAASVAGPAAAPPEQTYVEGCQQQPSDGDPCSAEGRLCTYGQALHAECHTHARCTQGRWQVTPPSMQCASAIADTRCPASAPIAKTCASADSMLRCAYPDGTDCSCFFSMLLTPLNGWLCDQPAISGNPKCTPQPPNAGTRCDLGPTNTVGPGCNYGCGQLSGTFLVATCSADAIWTWSETSCARTN